ncbi:MAG: hypothetical protein COY80_05025 [Candidatus Pacebacteria bacterium CG_4_10_14_0_8_um_filter_42_14]|nr:MAG: hypothetical protein COY80_05025 [Candidatus Pacebacteria bacterium CG_4_10_14_0_8_um_filter_42_14]
MKQVGKLKQLENLSYFGTETLAQITDLEGNSLYKNISRWLKQDSIIQLKRGLYTTSAFTQKQNNQSYFELISNKLRYPSYLSLEYVLAKHQMLTESVYSFTSITQKSTREYSSSFGRFSYKKVANALFTGYSLEEKNGFQIATATKAKALFDYLYLKFQRNSIISETMIEDLRLNLDEFTKADIEEFAGYCELATYQKFKKLYRFIDGS